MKIPDTRATANEFTIGRIPIVFVHVHTCTGFSRNQNNPFRVYDRYKTGGIAHSILLC